MHLQPLPLRYSRSSPSWTRRGYSFGCGHCCHLRPFLPDTHQSRPGSWTPVPLSPARASPQSLRPRGCTGSCNSCNPPACRCCSASSAAAATATKPTAGHSLSTALRMPTFGGPETALSMHLSTAWAAVLRHLSGRQRNFSRRGMQSAR